MAGVAVNYQSEGFAEATRTLRALGNFELAKLSDEMAGILIAGVQGRFVSKLGPDGTPWAPWSDEYADRRPNGKSLLMDEGELLDTLESYSTAFEVMVGSNEEYAAIHQFGGEEVGKNIPARPYLGVSEADERELADLIAERVAELFP